MAILKLKSKAYEERHEVTPLCAMHQLILPLLLPSFPFYANHYQRVFYWASPFITDHIGYRYKSVGIRLDSGDLAYLSGEARKIFQIIEKEFGLPGFGKTSITASNDLNEETLDALNKQGHEVDCYGIGTYLVTCYAQAALGCVFKLVEINNQPRIKLSEDVSKVSIPCKKRCYRLYGREGYSLVDIMTGENEPCPKVGERILCRHPFNESKRAYVVPQRVEELLKCYWPGKSGKVREELPALKDIRDHCIKQLEQMRPDHIRRLNPTPYKVSVSAKLYDFIHFLWLNEAPVGELQ
ncbi:nicotinate phosphoribosyltransferase 2-like isoform X1 [Gossypium australe]|uniref:nicotinate phosphoribosyltransferase n=1 Tax=Gossypium australe TaxID=47621 RepID=A0A5B6VZ51_9ROSI|nr:nicotinate phosphoribosyltransferase 2-like isoform X1 [Gossypium australe]